MSDKTVPTEKEFEEFKAIINEKFGPLFPTAVAAQKAQARKDAIAALATEEGEKRILDVINRVYAKTSCVACGTPHAGTLQVWGSLSHILMSPNPITSSPFSGLLLDGLPSLVCLVVQCKTCGLTHMHDASLLGLIPPLHGQIEVPAK